MSPRIGRGLVAALLVCSLGVGAQPDTNTQATATPPATAAPAPPTTPAAATATPAPPTMPVAATASPAPPPTTSVAATATPAPPATPNAETSGAAPAGGTTSPTPPSQDSAPSAPVGAPAPGTPLPQPTAPLQSPSPVPSQNPAARTRLHRPGTDVDSDLLTGSLASQVYVLKGNVTLHSDPKIDRTIADASESDEPLTITADEVDVDRLGLSYVAKGNVRFAQGSRSGRADLAMLNEQAHTLDLVGNASVLDGERRATAAKMHYNTLDKQFLGSGDVRIYGPLPSPNPKPSGTPAGKRKRRFPL